MSDEDAGHTVDRQTVSGRDDGHFESLIDLILPNSTCAYSIFTPEFSADANLNSWYLAFWVAFSVSYIRVVLSGIDRPYFPWNLR